MTSARWWAMFAFVLSVGSPALAEGLHRGTLALAGDHHLRADEGHVVVIGGSVRAPEAVRIAGTVVMFGGTFALDGAVAGDMIHFGGTLSLGERARVEGRLVAAGGTLSLAHGATVVGGILRDLAVASELVRPPPTLAQRGLRLVVQVVLASLLAMLVARLMPRALERTSGALAGHTIVALAMGALSGLVGLVLVVAMVSTVVLIPVAVIGLALLFGAVGWGWLAWGRVIGRELAKRGWAPASVPAATAAGTAAFVLGQDLVAAVPWVGGPVALAASVAALGAGVLTGFGGRTFVPDAERRRLDA